jgi:hypothetical protein
MKDVIQEYRLVKFGVHLQLLGVAIHIWSSVKSSFKVRTNESSISIGSNTSLKAVCIGSNTLNSRNDATTTRWKALVTWMVNQHLVQPWRDTPGQTSVERGLRDLHFRCFTLQN